MRNVSEDNFMQQVVKEIMNMIIRNIGWMAVDIMLYGGENLLRFFCRNFFRKMTLPDEALEPSPSPGCLPLASD